MANPLLEGPLGDPMHSRRGRRPGTSSRRWRPGPIPHLEMCRIRMYSYKFAPAATDSCRNRRSFWGVGRRLAKFAPLDARSSKIEVPAAILDGPSLTTPPLVISGLPATADPPGIGNMGLSSERSIGESPMGSPNQPQCLRRSHGCAPPVPRAYFMSSTRSFVRAGPPRGPFPREVPSAPRRKSLRGRSRLSPRCTPRDPLEGTPKSLPRQALGRLSCGARAGRVLRHLRRRQRLLLVGCVAVRAEARDVGVDEVCDVVECHTCRSWGNTDKAVPG